MSNPHSWKFSTQDTTWPLNDHWIFSSQFEQLYYLSQNQKNGNPENSTIWKSAHFEKAIGGIFLTWMSFSSKQPPHASNSWCSFYKFTLWKDFPPQIGAIIYRNPLSIPTENTVITVKHPPWWFIALIYQMKLFLAWPPKIFCQI